MAWSAKGRRPKEKLCRPYEQKGASPRESAVVSKKEEGSGKTRRQELYMRTAVEQPRVRKRGSIFLPLRRGGPPGRGGEKKGRFRERDLFVNEVRGTLGILPEGGGLPRLRKKGGGGRETMKRKKKGGRKRKRYLSKNGIKDLDVTVKEKSRRRRKGEDAVEEEKRCGRIQKIPPKPALPRLAQPGTGQQKAPGLRKRKKWILPGTERLACSVHGKQMGMKRFPAPKNS